MNQVILASHGGMAEGVRDTLSMVLGEVGNIHVISMQRDDTDSVADRAREIISGFPDGDEVYICTDMLGSSVNNAMVELLHEHPEIKVISGMNMPLVLSLAVSSGRLQEHELANLIAEARLGLRDCGNPDVAPATPKKPAAGSRVSKKSGKANIRLVRLDYRLIHGQVVFSWVNSVGAERIIVVDNAAAQDPVRMSALKLAKPSGVRLNIFTVERALSKMAKLNTLGENVMMVFGNVHELLEFYRGYALTDINFGAAANHDGAIPVGGKDSSVFLDESERADAQALLDLGAKIYEQQTPSQPRTNITSFR